MPVRMLVPKGVDFGAVPHRLEEGKSASEDAGPRRRVNYDVPHWSERKTFTSRPRKGKIQRGQYLLAMDLVVTLCIIYYIQMMTKFMYVLKDVENILERTMRIKKGKRTTRELFTQEHKELVKEAEKWVKSTANSCMLVATLIATVVFAAAFTVPGGNDENNGSPMFLSHKWFTVFVVSDAIALISSSTSILLFLSILTSRCAETDFLFWLPLELVLGLGSLFLSVLGMVLAFSACFFLHYGR